MTNLPGGHGLYKHRDRQVPSRRHEPGQDGRKAGSKVPPAIRKAKRRKKVKR
jgi:hypothetical protein